MKDRDLFEAARGRLCIDWFEESRTEEDKYPQLPRPRGTAEEYVEAWNLWFRIRPETQPFLDLANPVVRGSIITYKVLGHIDSEIDYSNWKVMFHGTHFYPLRNTIVNGLLASEDAELGHRMLDNDSLSGSYLTRLINTAWGYAKATLMFDEQRWQKVVIEVLANNNDYAHPKRISKVERSGSNKQEIYPERGVRLTYVHIDTNAPPQEQEWRYFSWKPELEAPFPAEHYLARQQAAGTRYSHPLPAINRIRDGSFAVVKPGSTEVAKPKWNPGKHPIRTHGCGRCGGDMTKSGDTWICHTGDCGHKLKSPRDPTTNVEAPSASASVQEQEFQPPDFIRGLSILLDRDDVDPIQASICLSTLGFPIESQQQVARNLGMSIPEAPGDNDPHSSGAESAPQGWNQGWRGSSSGNWERDDWEDDTSAVSQNRRDDAPWDSNSGAQDHAQFPDDGPRRDVPQRALTPTTAAAPFEFRAFVGTGHRLIDEPETAASAAAPERAEWQGGSQWSWSSSTDTLGQNEPLDIRPRWMVKGNETQGWMDLDDEIQEVIRKGNENSEQWVSYSSGKHDYWADLKNNVQINKQYKTKRAIAFRIPDPPEPRPQLHYQDEDPAPSPRWGGKGTLPAFLKDDKDRLDKQYKKVDKPYVQCWGKCQVPVRSAPCKDAESVMTKCLADCELDEDHICMCNCCKHKGGWAKNEADRSAGPSGGPDGGDDDQQPPEGDREAMPKTPSSPPDDQDQPSDKKQRHSYQSEWERQEWSTYGDQEVSAFSISGFATDERPPPSTSDEASENDEEHNAWGNWHGTDGKELVGELQYPPKARKPRQPGTKRRGGPSNKKRTARSTAYAAAAAATTAAGSPTTVCICETGFSYIEVMIIVIGIILIGVTLWYLCRQRRTIPLTRASYGLGESPTQWAAKSKAKAKAKSQTRSATANPEQVYFSTSAVARTRCYHITDQCRGLTRAPSVCTAVACKICVGNEGVTLQCFSDASFLD